MSGLIEQIKARAYQKTAQEIQHLFATENVFNETEDLMDLKNFYELLLTKQQAFQAIVDTNQLENQLANSEQARKARIAELVSKKRDLDAKTVQYRAETDAQSREFQKSAQSVVSQADQLQQEFESLQLQLQTLDGEHQALCSKRQVEIQTIEQVFELSIAAKEYLAQFSTIFQNPAARAMDCVMFSAAALLKTLNTIVGVLKLYNLAQEFEKVQKYIKTQAFQVAVLSFASKIEPTQLANTMRMNLDQDISQQISHYCQSQWSIGLEMAVKENIKVQSFEFLKERSMKIQGSAYKTDRCDLCVIQMIMAILALQGHELKCINGVYKV